MEQCSRNVKSPNRECAPKALDPRLAVSIEGSCCILIQVDFNYCPLCLKDTACSPSGYESTQNEVSYQARSPTNTSSFLRRRTELFAISPQTPADDFEEPVAECLLCLIVLPKSVNNTHDCQFCSISSSGSCRAFES